MPAYTYTVALPTMIQTSSAVDTSTHAIPAWDISDATAVTFTWVGDTTAPGPKCQIALTSESTATFFTLTYVSSGASQVITSSTIAVLVTPVAAKQMRIVTTAIHTGTQTSNAVKAVIV